MLAKPCYIENFVAGSEIPFFYFLLCPKIFLLNLIDPILRSIKEVVANAHWVNGHICTRPMRTLLFQYSQIRRSEC